MATLKVDADFNIHTSYHNDFFLLRTKVLVNGEKTEIRYIKDGRYEGPVMTFGHSGSTISIKRLSLILKAVSSILARHEVYHVDMFYYEQSPLFHVVFSSESCLKNFVFAIGAVKSALEAEFHSLFLKNVVLETEPFHQLTVEVQPDLFLVSPSRQKTTRAPQLHPVTIENCSTFVIRWKDSKLFDFETLFQDRGMHVDGVNVC